MMMGMMGGINAEPPGLYLTEDGLGYYVLENESGFYTQES